MKTVYFMQQGTTGPIKIGHTSNLGQRFAALKVASPHLRLLAVLVGGNEGRLHERFDAFHIEGEWFHPARELLAFIELLPKEMSSEVVQPIDPICSGENWSPPVVVCPKCKSDYLHIDDVQVDLPNEVRIHFWCENCEGEPMARASVGWLILAPHEGVTGVVWRLSSDSK